MRGSITSVWQGKQKRDAAKRLQLASGIGNNPKVPILPTGSQDLRPSPTPSSKPQRPTPTSNPFSRLPPRPPKPSSTSVLHAHQQLPQHPPASFTQNPIPNQRPSHIPPTIDDHSSGRHKRKQPDEIKSENACLDHDHQPCKYAALAFLGEEKYYCEICEVHCLCEMNYEMHIKGRKHKFMTNMSAINGSGGGSGKGGNNQELPRCEVCEIYCMNEVSMQQHLCGKKHMVNVQKKKIKSHVI